MTTATMKKWLQEIIAIEDTVKRINSEEFRAEAVMGRESRFNPYPAMCGSLEGATYKPVVNAKIMLSHMPDIERLERIASAFESLDIDLSDESLKALELLASERRYWHEQETLSEKIQSTIFDICNQERELEYQEACESIKASGFTDSPDESDSNFTRDNETIRLGTDHRNDCSTYTWELYRKSMPIASGKSGEFSRLLSAISPVAQDASKTSGCESPQGTPKTSTSGVPMVAD